MPKDRITLSEFLIGGSTHKPLVEAEGAEVISISVPLLIRLMEYTMEDIKGGDVELHQIAERIMNMGASTTLTMEHYNKLVRGK